MAVGIPVDYNIRCKGANANTGDSLQSMLQVRGIFAFFNTKMLLDQFQYGFSAPHVAGSSPAYPDYVLTPWCGVKLGIKANYPLYLTWKQAQASGDAWYCLGRNVAQHVLYFMEKWY